MTQSAVQYNISSEFPTHFWVWGSKVTVCHNSVQFCFHLHHRKKCLVGAFGSIHLAGMHSHRCTHMLQGWVHSHVAGVGALTCCRVGALTCCRVGALTCCRGGCTHMLQGGCTHMLQGGCTHMLQGGCTHMLQGGCTHILQVSVHSHNAHSHVAGISAFTCCRFRYTHTSHTHILQGWVQPLPRAFSHSSAHECGVSCRLNSGSFTFPGTTGVDTGGEDRVRISRAIN